MKTAHRIMQALSAFLAAVAMSWGAVPLAWQQHVPGWLLGALAVATMALPSPVIRDPPAPDAAKPTIPTSL